MTTQAKEISEQEQEQDRRERIQAMLDGEAPNEGSLTAPADRDRTKRWRPSMAAPLTDEELKCAQEDLVDKQYIKKYSQAERSYADPVLPAQLLGLISFVPAKGATANKNGVYGFAKLRGNYSTMFEADKRAEMLIRDHDSYNQNFHVLRRSALSNHRKPKIFRRKLTRSI